MNTSNNQIKTTFADIAVFSIHVYLRLSAVAFQA
jgi:hypothetical protein